MLYRINNFEKPFYHNIIDIWGRYIYFGMTVSRNSGKNIYVSTHNSK